MWGFLKKLKPAKEEPLKEEIININDAKLWLESIELRKKKEIEDRLMNISEEYKKITDEISSAIKTLEHAKLKNEKILEREKHFMQGNRKGYITQVRNFVETINIPLRAGEIDREISLYEKKIKAFSKSTARQYQILQEFFANESRSVASKIKKIDKIFQELKKFSKELNLTDIDNAKKDIDAIYSKNSSHDERRKDLMRIDEKMTALSEENKKLSKEISKLEKSEDIEFTNDLRDDILKLSEKIKEYDNEITAKFSSIKPALKKYLRLDYDDVDIADEYLQNTIDGLKRDFKLKIIHILNKIEVSIQNDTIELKPAKRSKALIAIESITEDYLRSFIKDYNNLCKEKIELEHKLESNKTLKKIKEVERKIKENNEKIASLKEEAHLLEDEINRLGIADDVAELEKRLSRIANVSLTLKA